MLSRQRARLVAGMMIGVLVTGMAMAADPAGIVKKPPVGKDAPAADGSIKLKLTPVNLNAPGWIMTPGDAQRASLVAGSVMPQRTAVLTPEKTAEVNIGGIPATLVFNGRDVGIKTEFSAVQLQPTRTRDGFFPATVKIAKDKSYAVAFPYAVIAPPKSVSLGLRPGFAMRGQANGISVLLYDDNMDGKFTLGQDAVRIGEGGSVGVFAPAAKYIATPTGAYEIAELAEDGSSITLKKADVSAGKLQIGFPSDQTEIHAAFACGKETSFVAVANPRLSPTFAVPPGKYDFKYGVAYAPGLNKVVAIVTPSAGLESVEVSAEKPGKVALGGPFQFVFDARLSGGKINISPTTIKLKGKNGEEYRDFKYTTAPEIGMMAGGKSVMLGKMSFS